MAENEVNLSEYRDELEYRLQRLDRAIERDQAALAELKGPARRQAADSLAHLKYERSLLAERHANIITQMSE